MPSRAEPLSDSSGSTPTTGAEVEIPDGLVAVGGDLGTERLIEAYRRGIFPWPLDEGMPLMWWSPDPRFVLYPHELHVGRSLRQRMRSQRFEIRYDTDFERVIEACAAVPREDGPGTWITRDMCNAYVNLHRRGFAHSIESWRDGELVGGFYGVAMGSVFFGESMFFHEPDASKVAFATFVDAFATAGGGLIDCQMETDHLARFGARGIRRGEFLEELAGFVEGRNVFSAMRAAALDA